MTESTPTTDTLSSGDTRGPAPDRDSRVYHLLAWVGIVAGVVFIVAVVFFSGFFAARVADGNGWHRGYQNSQMRPGGPMGGGCPMMQMQGGGMGPGGMSPGGMNPGGMSPGGMNPGGMGPGTMGPAGTRPPTPTSSMPMPMPPAGQR